MRGWASAHPLVGGTGDRPYRSRRAGAVPEQSGQFGALSIGCTPLHPERLPQCPQRPVTLELIANPNKNPKPLLPGTLQRLSKQPGLADSCLALDERDPRPPRRRTSNQHTQGIPLSRPADERDPRPNSDPSHSTILGP